MITLWRKFKKIFRQLQGSENIFDYQSTVPNQLYLLYCFAGKMYFTDKVHHTVKYFWYGVLTCQIVFAYAMAADYLWYSFRCDLVMILNVLNQFGALHLGAFGFPLLLYLYGNHIEALIAEVDNILDIKADSTGFKQQKIMADAKKYCGLFLAPLIINFTLFVVICIPDMAFFFEQGKAENYLYYAMPPPLVQKYGSHIRWCIIGQCITSIIFLIMMMQMCLTFALTLYFCVICFNELTSLCSFLNASTCDLNKRIEQGQRFTDWNKIFVRRLKYSTRDYQRIIRWINYLRGVVGVIATISVVCGFLYSIAQLYFCRSGDLSLVLNVKFFLTYTAVVISVGFFYWIGQRLHDSITEVSVAVYNTPWYQSVEVRKDVYLFLCQIQSTKNFAIFNVYPLLFCNFSRFLHGILSCTNILLRFTDK